jgi:hypothetical protein
VGTASRLRPCAFAHPTAKQTLPGEPGHLQIL